MSELLSQPPAGRVNYATAAKYLGIPEGTLRSMVCRGQLPFVRLSSRIVVFDLAVLDTWIASVSFKATNRVAKAQPQEQRVSRAIEISSPAPSLRDAFKNALDRFFARTGLDGQGMYK